MEVESEKEVVKMSSNKKPWTHIRINKIEKIIIRRRNS